MTDKIFFAEACANSFILVDCLTQKTVCNTVIKKAHQNLLNSGRDDAMVLYDGVVKENALFFKLLLIGADLEFGEFCGNGSRAIAAYLYKHYQHCKEFYINSTYGTHQLKKHPDGIYSTMLPTVNFKPNKKFVSAAANLKPVEPFFQYQEENFSFYYSDIMEPHLLLKSPIQSSNLLQLAQKINDKNKKFPKGINITAYQIIGKNRLSAITYERGIKRFTQSCGTGACCAAAHFLNGKSGRVLIKNPGGVLEIKIGSTHTILKGAASLT